MSDPIGAYLKANPPGQRRAAPPRVPERFQDVRLSSTQPRPEVQGWEEALAAVHEWIRAVATGEHAMMALVGPAGVSKSHLAFAAAWELQEEHNVHVPCFSWYELVDALRSGRIITTPSGIREVPPGQVRHDWHESKVAIVDECRPTSGTDFDAMELAKFSMNRYDRKRSALLTCNWASLGELIGDPAADRYTTVTLVGPSFRGDDR